MTYRELWQKLSPEHGEREAKSIARMVFEQRFGLSLTDICMGKDNELSDNARTESEEIARRLAEGEPVQYVIGRATFRGREFIVKPGVLIPRPETEQLIDLMDIHRNTGRTLTTVLDIGTGSGCIAVSAAIELPEAKVTAWDISPEAIDVAMENARLLGAKVDFRLQDALSPPDDNDLWDIVVSNPPYICEHERSTMQRQVTDHEPHLALFVPDNKPLLFYETIAGYSAKALKHGGVLIFETNHMHAEETAETVKGKGLQKVSVINDIYGRPRFVTAVKA